MFSLGLRTSAPDFSLSVRGRKYWEVEFYFGQQCFTNLGQCEAALTAELCLKAGETPPRFKTKQLRRELVASRTQSAKALVVPIYDEQLTKVPCSGWYFRFSFLKHWPSPAATSGLMVHKMMKPCSKYCRSRNLFENRVALRKICCSTGTRLKSTSTMRVSTPPVPSGSRLLGSSSIGHGGSDTRPPLRASTCPHRIPARTQHRMALFVAADFRNDLAYRKSSSAAQISRLPLSFAWPHSAAETRQAHLISSKALGRINSFAVLPFQYIVKTLLTEAYAFKRADIFMRFRLPALLFSLRVRLSMKKVKRQKKKKKKNGQLELNCLSLRVVYSNQAVWETWMDRCMLGNSTGLRSEACCEHCPQTDIHTVCPSHEGITLTLQLQLLDKNKTIL